MIDKRIGLTNREEDGGEGERTRVGRTTGDAAKDNLSALFTLTNQTVASVQAWKGERRYGGARARSISVANGFLSRVRLLVKC